MIQTCLDTQITDGKATRFEKKDSTNLRTVEIVQESENYPEKLSNKGFSSTLFIINQYFSGKMGYRLSDGSNARSLVTRVPNVNQLRNVDLAVKVNFLGTAPTKIRKANGRAVI